MTSASSSISEWAAFLQDYSKGHERPAPPLYKPPANLVAEQAPPPPLPSFDTPLYPPGEISAETAKIIAEFYHQYNFLPPPRADEERRRQAVISEYNLFRHDQTENFDRCLSLVHAIFSSPIVTISLFQNDVQVVVSKTGEFPVNAGDGMVTETSICGHVVLKKNGVPTELSDINSDWRFFGNPWCNRNGGVQGYIGIPITLDDPSNPLPSQRVTVGVVALMSNQPFPTLTERQRDILHNIAAMLSVQLRATWEGFSGGKETRMRNGVSLFLEKALVEPSQAAVMKAQLAIDPPIQGSSPIPVGNRKTKPLTTFELFASAAQQISELLEADLVAIVDLAPFHVQGSHQWIDPDKTQGLSQQILASCGSMASHLANNFAAEQAGRNVAQFLDLFTATARSIFPAPWGLSGLEPLIGTTKRDRGSNSSVPHIALPFYSANQPKLLIIVSSAAPLFTFNQSDVTFARNLGLVLMARMAQNVVVEASAHRTAFVSQMSHELRTPLHGLLGQLDLLRDRLSCNDLTTANTLLDSAELCGTALREIVDDVLDFGKMSRASTSDADSTISQQRNATVDLLQITSEAVRASWTRRLHFLSATAVTPSELREAKQDIELILEYEDRSNLKDWWINIDVPGFRRILNNLLTNSLKYTSKGTITISLVSGLGVNSAGNPVKQITLCCADTGRGIQPEFIDKIFEPFTQADSFSPGAGLGLHITKSIVDRMQGTITVDSTHGHGTSFTVVLPIDDMLLRPDGTALKMQRTLISEDSTPKPPSSSTTVDVSEASKPKTLPSSTKADITTSPLPASIAENEPHLTILVVDDNFISRKILVTISQKLNATTHQAEDGLEALEVFRKVHPHVVWTDVSMPRMDGVTAAKEMRAIEREQGWSPSHIVAITGLGMSDEHIRREALMSSAALDGWLIKGQVNMKGLRESLVALRRKLRALPAFI
ncbi:hypothetical protein C8F01DRAFT_1128623 [Mycena amicta]|nr:hypothetical protein C8F01DRAFT_1128623 [Mycena amicta]